MKYIPLPVKEEISWKDSSFNFRIWRMSNLNYLFAAFSSIDTVQIEVGMLKLITVDSVKYFVRDGNWIIGTNINKFDYELFPFTGDESVPSISEPQIFLPTKKSRNPRESKNSSKSN